jgi:hypothetical protein
MLAGDIRAGVSTNTKMGLVVGSGETCRFPCSRRVGIMILQLVNDCDIFMAILYCENLGRLGIL